MGNENKVLVVDDNLGGILWMIDFLKWRGYEVDHVANERAARERLLAFHQDRASYVLAIFDVMIAVEDVAEVEDFDESFFEKSRDTGIRLCLYARNELGITEGRLPIVCLSARQDDRMKQDLADLEVPVFGRDGEELRAFLKKKLPTLL